MSSREPCTDPRRVAQTQPAGAAATTEALAYDPVSTRRATAGNARPPPLSRLSAWALPGRRFWRNRRLSRRCLDI
jgi:hypothetical protein